MTKDFTDYVLLILGERHSVDPEHKGMLITRHIYHAKHYTKKDLKDMLEKGIPMFYTHGGYRYVFKPSQAVHLKGWMPWLLYDAKHPYREMFRMMKESIRALWIRTGLLIYREPLLEGK